MNLQTNQRLNILCLLLIFLLSAAIQAAISGDYEYVDNRNGTCSIINYFGPGGDLIIPGSLNGLTVTGIGNDAFFSKASLTSVVIPDSVIIIGIEAFYWCTGLSSVKIGNSVTEIGHHAFLNCDGLTSVTIPDSVATIEYNAFYDCSNLSTIMIGSNVSSIGISAFGNCANLTAISVDPLNSAYTSVGGILFDKEQTTIIQYPAGKAGTYTIPDTVTTIGDGAFYRCSGLTDVTIGNRVTAIGNEAFSQCSGLTGKLIIPDSVTIIGYHAFQYCPGLTGFTIGNGVATIGNYVFSNCYGLTCVYFKGDAPSLGSNVFWGVDLATVYYIPGTVGWGETYGGLPTAEWPLSVADINMNGDVNLSDFDGLQRKLKSTGKIWVLIKIHNFDRITVEIESTPPTNKDQFYSDLADAILDAFEANEFYP